MNILTDLDTSDLDHVFASTGGPAGTGRRVQQGLRGDAGPVPDHRGAGVPQGPH